MSYHTNPIAVEHGTLTPVPPHVAIFNGNKRGFDLRPQWLATSPHVGSETFETRAIAEFWLWLIAERVEGRRNRPGA